MNDNGTNEPSREQFSDDPKEKLRLENEILHVRLKAELGGELVNDPALPPELENEFLKNILAFEHAYANVKQVRIFDLLGKPSYKKQEELDEQQIEAALNTMNALLREKDIQVDYNANYSSRVKYTFITEQLFEHETDDVQMPGMTKHFLYEDFHQNHRFDIEIRATEFLSNWFTMKLNEQSWELGSVFILEDGMVLPKVRVIEKIRMMFDAYTSFTDCRYTVGNLVFEVDEAKGTGLGNMEGEAAYTATLENGEQIRNAGAFNVCLSLEDRLWSIYYFLFPGFNW